MLSIYTIMKMFSALWLDLRVSTAFLTRLPTGPGTEASRPLADAARVFPLVGAGIGAVMGLTLFLASTTGLHPLACAFAGLAVGALLTGALHEDGLADTADGFGGGETRAKKLKIMKDSRIGVYGMLAIIFSIGLRASALSGMPSPGTAALALVSAGALSRTLMLGLPAMMDSARKDGLGASVGCPGNETIITAALLGAALAFLFPFPGTVLAALVTSLAATAALVWLAQNQIGGFTGDVLGAAQQVAEVVILMALATAIG